MLENANRKLTIFIEKWELILAGKQNFVWQIPLIKELFYLFFAFGSVLILWDTYQKKSFPLDRIKSLFGKLLLISLLFPSLRAFDFLINQMTIELHNGTQTFQEKGMSKYTALEILYMSDLLPSIKENAGKAIEKEKNYKLSADKINGIIEEKAVQEQKKFVDEAIEIAHFLQSDQLSYTEKIAMNSLEEQFKKNTGQGILSSFFAWSHHLIQNVVLVWSQTLALSLLYFITIALILSFVPFLENIFIFCLQLFLSLKTIPILLLFSDFVIDDLGVFAVTIESLQGQIANAYFSTMCYSLLKISLAFGAVYLSFRFFKNTQPLAKHIGSSTFSKPFQF